MKIENFTQELEIPEGIEVKIENGLFTVKGKKGEIKRDLSSPKIKYLVENNKIKLVVDKATKREKRLVFTMLAHIKNLFKGVTEGFTYKLAICASHFPMNVGFSNGELTVKNFLGESVPRRVTIPSDVDVKIDGKTIVLTGVDIEKVGDAATKIEKLTRRPGFDRRRFQDGIYIIEKNGKVM